MTCCPFCKARGCKLSDPLAGDYCGQCGRTWPRDIAANVESDGTPPPEQATRPLLSFPHVPRPAGNFPTRVEQIAATFKTHRWRDQFAVPLKDDDHA
jgi:hypothetical protein